MDTHCTFISSWRPGYPKVCMQLLVSPLCDRKGVYPRIQAFSLGMWLEGGQPHTQALSLGMCLGVLLDY